MHDDEEARQQAPGGAGLDLGMGLDRGAAGPLRPDLSRLSEAELAERVSWLEDEIARTRAMIESKQAARQDAESWFAVR